MPDFEQSVLTDSGGKMKVAGWRKDDFKPSKAPVFGGPEEYVPGTRYTITRDEPYGEAVKSVIYRACPVTLKDGVSCVHVDQAEMIHWTP